MCCRARSMSSTRGGSEMMFSDSGTAACTWGYDMPASIAEDASPTALVGQEVRDHRVVRGRLRVFAMEADFERKHRRPFNLVRADHLGFVVLTNRLLGTEPHLDPVAMRAVAARTELGGSH